MLLFTAALALFAGAAVQATTIPVEVGAGGNNFNPTSVTAAAGDVILFTFKNGSHTVTQSTFATPCSPSGNGTDAGPFPVAGTTTPPTFNLTVNTTDPVWIYCKTGTHCKVSGMVFAINPTAAKTYDAFKANALGTGTNGTASSAPSGSASTTGSTSPAATTSPSAANGRASVGIGAVAAALLFGGMNAI